MRWIQGLVAVTMLATSGLTALGQAKSAQPAASAAKVAAPKSAAAQPLLPEAFAGWEADAVKPLADPTQVDAASAVALKEYGLTAAATATYKRDSQTLTLHALRFEDASGAFGAFSFYRQNNWPKEEIGSGAGSFHNRVVFWKGNLLIDATFSRIASMSGSELRELAKGIESPAGSRGLMPPVLQNLPKASQDAQSTHYAVGASGYSASGVLPAQVVGFDRGAEVATASYAMPSGPATLTIIDYPTPQLAEAMEGQIRAYIQAGSKAQPAWTKALTDSDKASLEVRRSGPLVILVSGDAIPKESHKLLERVHFESDVTNLPRVGGDTEVTRTSKLLLGIAALIIIGGSTALLLGFFLGGGRALYRIARGKPASSLYDDEFIRIDFQSIERERAKRVDTPGSEG